MPSPSLSFHWLVYVVFFSSVYWMLHLTSIVELSLNGLYRMRWRACTGCFIWLDGLDRVRWRACIACCKWTPLVPSDIFLRLCAYQSFMLFLRCITNGYIAKTKLMGRFGTATIMCLCTGNHAQCIVGVIRMVWCAWHCFSCVWLPVRLLDRVVSALLLLMCWDRHNDELEISYVFLICAALWCSLRVYI